MCFHEGTGAWLLPHEHALRREPVLSARRQPLDLQEGGWCAI